MTIKLKSRKLHCLKFMFCFNSGDLQFGLVWILNGQKEVGLQMVQILKGIWNPKVQPFEIPTNGRKRPDFEWSGFQMVRTIATAQPFENRTTYLKYILRKVWISNVSGFLMFGFQIPTVIRPFPCTNHKPLSLRLFLYPPFPKMLCLHK